MPSRPTLAPTEAESRDASHPVGSPLLSPSLAAGARCAAAPRPAPAAPEPPGITARGIGTGPAGRTRYHRDRGADQGSGAQEALDANSRLATSTIDALHAAGVAEADLRTSQLSVSPTQDPNTGRITGYEVSNMLTATLRDVDRAGSVIDAAGTAAGDAVRVQQLEFSIADDSAPRARPGPTRCARPRSRPGSSPTPPA